MPMSVPTVTAADVDPAVSTENGGAAPTRVSSTSLSVHKGQSVTWHELKLQVGEKKILNGLDDEGMSGALYGGGFCAIMGPSGAGKTSLLNALAGRVTGATGTVRIGGRTYSKNELRGRIAYVMQQDILCGTQTPREALMFSAALRLPQTVPLKDKEAIVEATLKELGIHGCADTLIGDDLIRGISGGEKKRTSIGVELVVQPQVLFLDEPTSGLDSYAAFSVVQNLLELSSSGCTVLCTIHQPSSEIFDLFTEVLFLSKGATFYFGPAKDLAPSLSANDFVCKANYNPADYAMFLLQTEPTEKLATLARKFAEARPKHQSGANEAGSRGSSEELAPSGRVISSAGILVEIQYLALREKNTLIRDKAGLIATIMAPTLLNLLFALIFFNAGDIHSSTYTTNTHFGAITQVAIGGMFGSAQPLLLKFPLEAALFKREYGVGAYSSTTYFLSKTVVELPKSFIVAAITWLVSYWIIGLHGPIMYFILGLWLMSVAAASTALLLGCVSSNVEVALQASPAIFVPQILFAGFFIKSSQIPEALRWLEYLCSLRYGINLFLVNEFGPETTESWSPAQRLSASDLLKMNEINPDLWWVNVVVLLGIIIVFRITGIILLSRRANRGE
mmetsp:Transcript_6575/g.17034  ORF Transcript_6575/g.17034 Transcript_6575/m.17034 type:complete len:620 (+) Transcript_6575:22-1881(+)